MLNNTSSLQKSTFWLTSLILPFIFYLIVCGDFVTAQIPLNGDTAAHYTIFKYYINNIINGVTPLWEPFVYCGRPFLALLNGGVLNPLVTLASFGVVFGLTYYQVYVVFIVFYFFLGALGFYVLAQIVLKNRFYSILAYISLLFSGMGLMVFNQIYVVLIFVPSVWFFVFLLRFTQRFRKGDFLGICLCLMIMVISYYPFYLLTALLVFIVVFGIFYFRRSINILKRILTFVISNKTAFGFAFLGLVLVSVPLVAYKYRDRLGETVSPARHQLCRPPESLVGCFDGGKMAFDEVAYGGSLGQRISFSELFVHLDKKNYFTDDFFYIPLFVLLVLAVCALTPMTRLKKVVFYSFLLILFISLGGATPVHRFLYDHIFYFQYFRNFFFFIAFLIPLAILFAMLQLKSFLAINPVRKFAHVVIVVLLHFAFLALILSQGQNIPTSIWTVMGSMVLFAIVTYFPRSKGVLLFGALTFLFLLQPMEVFVAFRANASALNDQLFADHVVPKFEFRRPAYSRSGNKVFYFRDFDFESNLTLSDSDAWFNSSPDSSSLWHFFLMRSKHERSYLAYLKNKFYLFDAVTYYHPKDDIQYLELIGQAITDGIDTAYAMDSGLPIGETKEERFSSGNSNKQFYVKESRDFRVSQFNVNEIELKYDLDSPKFLVYTDNFTADWQAFIDENEVKLYRANGAAKGVVLPSGSHTLRMVYRPFPGVQYYQFMMLFLAVYVAVTLFLLVKENGVAGIPQKKGFLSFGSGSARATVFSGLLSTSAFFYCVAWVLTMVLVDPAILGGLRLSQFKTECIKTLNKSDSKMICQDYLRLIGEDQEALSCCETK